MHYHQLIFYEKGTARLVEANKGVEDFSHIQELLSGKNYRVVPPSYS